MVKVEKGGLLHSLGHAMGRGRVSTEPIFSHHLELKILNHQNLLADYAYVSLFNLRLNAAKNIQSNVNKNLNHFTFFPCNC
jgi:hypothetical protein